MAKGFQTNRERLEAIGSLGKNIGKRAKIACEWCDGKEDLRIWDYQPDLPPAMETLALLCRSCRALADGVSFNPVAVRSIRNALWSDIPAVAEGAARVLARCKEPWAREAITESLIDETAKAEILK